MFEKTNAFPALSVAIFCWPNGPSKQTNTSALSPLLHHDQTLGPPAVIHQHSTAFPPLLTHWKWTPADQMQQNQTDWRRTEQLSTVAVHWAHIWVKETLESFFNTLEPLYLSNAVIQTIHSRSNDKCTDMQCSQVLGRWWKLVGCIFGIFLSRFPSTDKQQILKAASSTPKLLEVLDPQTGWLLLKFLAK